MASRGSLEGPYKPLAPSLAYSVKSRPMRYLVSKTRWIAYEEQAFRLLYSRKHTHTYVCTHTHNQINKYINKYFFKNKKVSDQLGYVMIAAMNGRNCGFFFSPKSVRASYRNKLYSKFI